MHHVSLCKQIQVIGNSKIQIWRRITLEASLLCLPFLSSVGATSPASLWLASLWPAPIYLPSPTSPCLHRPPAHLSPHTHSAHSPARWCFGWWARHLQRHPLVEQFDHGSSRRPCALGPWPQTHPRRTWAPPSWSTSSGSRQDHALTHHSGSGRGGWLYLPDGWPLFQGLFELQLHHCHPLHSEKEKRIRIQTQDLSIWGWHK